MSDLSYEDGSHAVHRNLFLEEPAPIPDLDRWVEQYTRSQSRFTFPEADALKSLWDEGEEIRLREDSRFCEAHLPQQGVVPQWYLAHHKVANQVLLEAIEDELWDGSDLTGFLAQLDQQAPGDDFHVFAQGDQRFLVKQDESGTYHLALRTTVAVKKLSSEEKLLLDEVASLLLERVLEVGRKPWTTTELLDLIKTFVDHPGKLERIIPAVLSEWLIEQKEWARVGVESWIPEQQLPLPSIRHRYAVWPVFSPTTGVGNLLPQLVSESSLASDTIQTLEELTENSDPSSPRNLAKWNIVLRTVHLNEGYIPVPKRVRFLYPNARRLANVIALPGLWFADGSNFTVWLDSTKHGLFGPDLLDQFAFLEAGTTLMVTWRATGLIFQITGNDIQVNEEESRLVDLTQLANLRSTFLESYRGSLRAILGERDQPLSFQELYELLCKRQQHVPNSTTIRTILSSSPEFIFIKGNGKWCLNSMMTPEVGAKLLRRSALIGNEMVGGGRNIQPASLSESLSQLVLKHRQQLSVLRSMYVSDGNADDLA